MPNIYYLRPTNGLNTNDGLSFASAFQTFQKCLDTAVAGDEVRMCPEAVETTSVQIDADTNAGSETAPITFLPASTSDGSVDTSVRYPIQASASITAILSHTASTGYLRFYNVNFDGNSNATYAVADTADVSGYRLFANCRFYGATSHGFGIRGSSATILVGSELYNNGGSGIRNLANGRGLVYSYGSSFHDNTSYGVHLSRTQCQFERSLIYDNGDSGVFCDASAYYLRMVGNTVHGNAGDGVDLDHNAGRFLNEFYNNVFSSNGAYGVRFGQADTDFIWGCDYNAFYNNTLGQSDQTFPGIFNVTGDPLFESVVDGAENFRLSSSSSPLFEAGYGGMTIGALSLVEPTGGGTGGGFLVNGGLVR